MLSEFRLIQQFFRPLSETADPDVLINQGDDCAVVNLSAPLAFSIDTQVENRHFLSTMKPADIAYRGLACALSDLAAMGAEPAFFTLALSLTGKEDEQWLEQYAQGLRELADEFSCPLLGGDTTRAAELVQTFQVHGACPKPLSRSGARPGDLIVVSNDLGLGKAGLEALKSEGPDELIHSFLRPRPQINLGRYIRPLASSAIDISDGLYADLGHILEDSGVTAVLDLENIPMSDSYRSWVSEENQMRWALHGGDDYQLVFTCPPHMRKYMSKSPETLHIIGTIQAGEGPAVCRMDGKTVTIEGCGFQHFSG